jgi:hypothetical protein
MSGDRRLVKIEQPVFFFTGHRIDNDSSSRALFCGRRALPAPRNTPAAFRWSLAATLRFVGPLYTFLPGSVYRGRKDRRRLIAHALHIPQAPFLCSQRRQLGIRGGFIAREMIRVTITLNCFSVMPGDSCSNFPRSDDGLMLGTMVRRLCGLPGMQSQVTIPGSEQF